MGYGTAVTAAYFDLEALLWKLSDRPAAIAILQNKLTEHPDKLRLRPARAARCTPLQFSPEHPNQYL